MNDTYSLAKILEGEGRLHFEIITDDTEMVLDSPYNKRPNKEQRTEVHSGFAAFKADEFPNR